MPACVHGYLGSWKVQDQLVLKDLPMRVGGDEQQAKRFVELLLQLRSWESGKQT